MQASGSAGVHKFDSIEAGYRVQCSMEVIKADPHKREALVFFGGKN